MQRCHLTIHLCPAPCAGRCRRRRCRYVRPSPSPSPRAVAQIRLNELEQMPPNVEVSGGVGMLFKDTQLNRGRTPLAQPSMGADGDEPPQEDSPDDAAVLAAAEAAKRSAEQARAAQDALSLEERLLINEW